MLGVLWSSPTAAGAAASAAATDRWGSVSTHTGGRPDLAKDALERVSAPTLLIVGGEDPPVIEVNRDGVPAVFLVDAADKRDRR